MDIKTLQKDMIAAMKNKDKPRKESISALIQNIRQDTMCLVNTLHSLCQQKKLKQS